MFWCCHGWTTAAPLAALPRQLLDNRQAPVSAEYSCTADIHDNVTPLCSLVRGAEWITFRLVVLSYQCLYGSAPTYLTPDLFSVSRASQRQQLLSSPTTDLAIRHVSHATLGVMSRFRSCSHVGLERYISRHPFVITDRFQVTPKDPVVPAFIHIASFASVTAV